MSGTPRGSRTRRSAPSCAARVRRALALPGRLAAVIAAGLLAAGCLGLGPGTSAPLRYHVLSPVDAPPAAGAAAAGTRASMGVMPVKLPGYLDRPALVERRGTEILPNRSSAWAAPLDEELVRVLAENLRRQQPGAEIAVFPWRRGFDPEKRLAVDLTRFEIEDGAAVLHARWRLAGANGDGTPHAAESRIRVAVQGDGDGARVAALSRALGQMSAEIAAAFGR